LPLKNGAAAPLAGLSERADLDYAADVLISNADRRQRRKAEPPATAYPPASGL
ncbi:MAG: hypothetical protein ACI91O_001770, partial [Candidatus Poriferisodalaceae bacterium]